MSEFPRIPLSVRTALAAATLVAGEVAGFALPELARDWPWVAAFLAELLIAAWGCGVPRLAWPALFAAGMVLALRTECSLVALVEENSGLYGPGKALELPVESHANSWCRKGKGEWKCSFESHAGPLPLKVVMPLAKGGRPPLLGETWRCEGWISQPRDPDERWKRRTLWIGDARMAECVDAARDGSIRSRWEKVGEAMARGCGVGLDAWPETAGMLKAMLLGRRGGLSQERRARFADAGTVHVFAISGLHVMVVALVLRQVLSRIGLCTMAQGLFAIPLLVAYTALTGARPSAVRAAMMASIWLLALVFGRRPDSLSAWAITAFAVYAWSPELVYDLGCTLSFIVMLGIVFWCRWIRQFRSPLPDPAAFPPGWRRKLVCSCHEILGNIGVSFAAWVAGAPIVAVAFERFTPGGLVANVAVLFCAKFAVTIGAAAMATGILCVPLCALLNMAAALFVYAMAYLSERTAALSFSSCEVVRWTTLECASWYAFWLLLAVLLGRFLPRRDLAGRRWW